MNSAELTNTLASKLKMTKTDVSIIMENIAEVITNELKEDNSISISGFGTFESKKRNERVSVHPSTQKRLLIPPKLIVNFKPAGTLKDKIKTLMP